jgi:uncharacterized protein (DUF1330 family)
MAAYLIADIEVQDAEAFDEYRKLVPATLEPFGGMYIVRGGAVTPLEGGWEPKRVVMLEFPSMDALQSWYNSDAYKAPKALRGRASISRVVAVEGIA